MPDYTIIRGHKEKNTPLHNTMVSSTLYQPLWAFLVIRRLLIPTRMKSAAVKDTAAAAFPTPLLKQISYRRMATDPYWTQPLS